MPINAQCNNYAYTAAKTSCHSVTTVVGIMGGDSVYCVIDERKGIVEAWCIKVTCL